tara:strand:+ start:1296 stop:1478 length:183 start_codon:yes stop_codon:yes gene_type:complete
MTEVGIENADLLSQLPMGYNHPINDLWSQATEPLLNATPDQVMHEASYPWPPLIKLMKLS